MCDTTLEAINSKELEVPMDKNDELVPGVSELRDMLDNMTQARIMETESRGVPKKRWLIKPAHFFAAASYALVAMDNMYGDMYQTGNGESDVFIPRGYD